MIRRYANYIRKNIIRLPNFINYFILNINQNPTMIYGIDYQRYKKYLNKSDTTFNSELHLLNVVNSAIQTVPYYRRLYRGMTFKDINQFSKCFGFIDKDIVMINMKDFISDKVKIADYDFGTTGGTSGKPLQLIAPKTRYIIEFATIHSIWERIGYKFNVRAVIRNHRLPKRVIYKINPLMREVIFDGFRLNDNYFQDVYKTIRRLNIAFIHCYPSVAYEFSVYLLKNRLDVSFIKAFLCSSENIFDYQLDLVQNRLGIRFFNFYGHSEKLVLAGFCAKSDLYHIEPTYGYFELVDTEGNGIKQVGDIGEIVGTSFHNPGMPLIRYRTGDFAEYVGDICPVCHRRVPVIKNIMGRWRGDRIFNRDGSFVTTTALNLHDELYSVIYGLQYVQKEKGILQILIIKSPLYNSMHEEILYKHYKDKLNKDTKIEIKYVDELIKQPNGKFLLLISKVSSTN